MLFRDQCVSEVEELLRDRFVSVGIESPGHEGEQQRGALSGAKLDRSRSVDGAEGGSESHVLSDMLESPQQRLARGPGEGHQAPVESDCDQVETHRHGGDGRRTGRRRLGPRWGQFEKPVAQPSERRGRYFLDADACGADAIVDVAVLSAPSPRCDDESASCGSAECG